VAQQLIARLYRDLAQLLGRLAFDALLERSLMLARCAHPILERVCASPRGMLMGLDAPSLDGPVLREGAVAIVCQFVELLVVLVGEDLVVILLHDLWPIATEQDQE